ncbi:hypothetical protein ABW365_24250 [Enterococcus avium]
MIACSAKEIVMGHQSSLGPIDPQFPGGIQLIMLSQNLKKQKRIYKIIPTQLNTGLSNCNNILQHS